ncbi:hypothetical protein DMZ43_01095 [Meridianimaribacter sp. CL38]|uniref:abortive infection family protein n=1 Tax=Meridianimaribacter sp. CL38 TaxID=2213021 RepID=UPI0010394C49|nr:abortive infection family protein [Meridianimaribacter sp. CL38]TBV27676.1 hypothetical protein DMZ43_01095 [Meridianimaribacter sp. CL38]
MKLSDKNIKLLAKSITGDSYNMPYRTGQELVSFFNEIGANDEYGEGFPTRWRYAEAKIREFNNTLKIKHIIESLVDPRNYLEEPVFTCEEAVEEVNAYIQYDGFKLIKNGMLYKLIDLSGVLVQGSSVKKIDQDFIKEQISKCNSKIENGDFNGAITNSRSLAEAVMINIIEDIEGKEIKNDGKLENLYKKVKKHLNLKIDPATLPKTVIQILSGLDSIVSGLSGLSNNSGDRHANKFNTKEHHARLAVNSTLTLVDFLLDSKKYQKK